MRATFTVFLLADCVLNLNYFSGSVELSQVGQLFLLMHWLSVNYKLLKISMNLGTTFLARVKIAAHCCFRWTIIFNF
jgi:hypothetical protein